MTGRLVGHSAMVRALCRLAGSSSVECAIPTSCARLGGVVEPGGAENSKFAPGDENESRTPTRLKGVES